MYIYEGAMCCSTGVCGPSPDEELMRVASLVDKLNKSGASIERYNLTNNTNEFVENKTINSLLEEKGEDVLPVVIVDDEVVMTGKYPSNEEFYEMLFYLMKPRKRQIATVDLAVLAEDAAANNNKKKKVSLNETI